MTDPVFETIWDIIRGIFALNPAAFQEIRQFPSADVDSLALLIVFLAGFSQAVAQSIILFVNRVKPLRFAISLLLAAILFVLGYLVWSASIWLAGYWFLPKVIPWQVIADVLAFSYLPLLFSFLGALPYLGVPILRVLSVWNLLAVVVGFAVLAGLTAREVAWQVGVGWLLLQVLQLTVGQPIVNFGQWLTNQVAGVQMVKNQKQLEKLIYRGPSRQIAVSQPAQQALSANHLLTETPDSGPVETVEWDADRDFWADEPVNECVDASAEHGLTFPEPILPSPQPWLRKVVIYGGLALLALVTAVALDPVRSLILAWYQGARPLLRLAIDLTWIGTVGIVVAGLLAPLEALGWWAGWYGDPIHTISDGQSPFSTSQTAPYERYVVYLDGIGQSTSTYQPSVARFLSHLEHRLPADIALVKGLMSYSVLNRELTEDRPLAFFWRWMSSPRVERLGTFLDVLINLRNLMIVAVSADLRYGPIYNQGIAQRIYESLVQQGYPPEGGVPLTLVGYSGGGQIAMGTLPFLKQALGTPIEVISLAGVISGNVLALEVEQLYHLVGRRDPVERAGPVMFPRRWPVSVLSYWNRAKQKGKISFISLGPVGHQVPGGVFDHRARLPDGRSHLQQTIDLVMEILAGDLRHLLHEQKTTVLTQTRYYRYQAAPFNQFEDYPAQQNLDETWYRPVSQWGGRLILPDHSERARVNGVYLELLLTPPEYRQWQGQRVILQWQDDPHLQARLQTVTRDVHFSAEAEYSYRQGMVLPIRLNHWRLVDPLESLAGAHPVDDIVIKLPEPVQVRLQSPAESDISVVESQQPPFTLAIAREPVQITGRYYALVRFLEPVDDGLEHYRVVHFNPTTRQFDGPQATFWLPHVLLDDNGTAAATNRGLEQSPQNAKGWYVYGEQNHQGQFVVRSLLPRQLVSLTPERFITSHRQGIGYIRRESWSQLPAKKGTTESVLVAPGARSKGEALDQWQEGGKALLVHTYGGIGGNQREPAARQGLYFGHFAYGVATVVREPIADELQFDIQYHQVYTHNTQGLIAGTLHWSRYMGDRQWGFLGTRPVSDILIKLPAYTKPFHMQGRRQSALDLLEAELATMTARYRIGDGTGVTYVGPANNCAQDSNQAMYASAKRLEEDVSTHKAALTSWAQENPDQNQQLAELLALRKAIQWKLLPFGSARADWEEERRVLGSNLQDFPLKTLGRGLLSWRTMLPRKASDTITSVCLKYGASLWVLRTNQIGGYDPDIEPIAPNTL
jgi:predicted Abi (CAAX) family protease